jgi:ABC-type transport system involved in cytochrome c biogenesis permease subunit
VPLPRRAPLLERVATRRNLFWFLVAVAVALNGTIVYLGYVLLKEPRVIEPEGQAIKVPFADAKALLDRWRRWPVQHDGRVKPFDSFSAETVRTITGRSKFEGKDPVAVVLSWMMPFRPAPAGTVDYTRIDELSRRSIDPVFWLVAFDREANDVANAPDRKRMAKLAEKLDCDWENYPFILCDYHKLREEILRAEQGDNAKLDEEELHGKYMSPHVLRHSVALKKIVREARAERAKDSEKPKLTMLQLKAEEVETRLHLFDSTRSLGEFGAVAMDPYRNEWFRLDHLRYFFLEPPQDTGGRKIDGPMIWEHWQHDMRVQHDRDYKGKPKLAFPGDQARQVVAAFRATQAAYLSQDEEKFTAASTTFFDTVDRVGKELAEYPTTSTIDLELTFNRAVPFRKAWIAGVAAIVLLAVCLVVGGARGSLLARGVYGLGLLGYATALGFAVYGFYCRVAISGRPPVSNMYESIIWVSFMTAVFGLVLELVYRRGVIALAGGLISTLGFLLADQLPTTFSPKIEPLTAVLRSQYWLIIHVLTIVSSYAALALAWGLGNINIALILFAPRRGDLIRTLSHYSYKAIQVGVVLLFLGTMLGGFWAEE